MLGDDYSRRSGWVKLKDMNGIRKMGREMFTFEGEATGLDLLGFWQWSASNLTTNILRGWLAEYIVALDLGIADGVRREWDSFDLTTRDGIRIEVKSAAYLQSWDQPRPSRIRFSICPTMAWEGETFGSEKKRQADVYVFALLEHRDRATINPLDLSQWVFFVLPTKILDSKMPEQRTISLAALLRLRPAHARSGSINVSIESSCNSDPDSRLNRARKKHQLWFDLICDDKLIGEKVATK